MTRRIGIYGGAFNPPHIGHVNAVKTALEVLELDEVLVIPTGSPPHKAIAEGSPSSEERLRMAELAFEDMEQVIVSDVEIKRDGPSYTAETLLGLHELKPDAQFWLIVGADMFLSMQSWWHPEEIFSLCSVCVLSRKTGESKALHEQAEFLMQRYAADCVIVENEIIDISSTDLRGAILSGTAGEYLPKNVMDYIQAKGLYHGSK